MSDTQSQFSPEKQPEKSKSVKSQKKENKNKKSVQKAVEQKAKGKVPRKKKEKEKQKDKDKQSKKRKQSKNKKQQPGGQAKEQVREYMQKQNRPYNLLNVFDNLHGKIKKPVLQIVLNELHEEGFLSCKDFGKNKVYFLNQDKLNVSKESVELLSESFTQKRALQLQLSAKYKTSMDQYRKLASKKTIQQIQSVIQALQKSVEQLSLKKQSLMSEGSVKVDEAVVEKIQKQQKALRKQLSKRAKLTKECLSIWSQITQKKIPQIAQMMGIQM